MTWWQWVFVVTGALFWAGVALLVLLLILAPGKGWGITCGYGSWRRKRTWPAEGPECGHHIGPVWYAPEWTKRLRFEAHWIAKHPGAPRSPRKRKAAA